MINKDFNTFRAHQKYQVIKQMSYDNQEEDHIAPLGRVCYDVLVPGYGVATACRPDARTAHTARMGRK